MAPLGYVPVSTIVIADVPRVHCATHGVVQVAVPWTTARCWMPSTSSQPSCRRRAPAVRPHRIGVALDHVRATEHRALRAAGGGPLVGTRYRWLANADRMDAARWRQFAALRTSTLKTARAWALKEVAMQCWQYVRRGWAVKVWAAWFAWAARCRLPPVQAVARTIRKYLWGILNAIITGTTNARAQGLNARIQTIRRRACSYRNRARFRVAIYFHLGGLDLYPARRSPAHTNS